MGRGGGGAAGSTHVVGVEDCEMVRIGPRKASDAPPGQGKEDGAEGMGEHHHHQGRKGMQYVTCIGLDVPQACSWVIKKALIPIREPGWVG